MKETLSAASKRFYDFVEKYDWLIFAGLILLYFISRLFLLEQVPRGFNCDELGGMYDSFSMALDHTDRYRYRFPVYTKNFGGGMSMLYNYLTSVLIAVFGFSKLISRLTAVLCGAAFLVCGYFLAKRVFRSKKGALCLALLITISPVYFMSQRWALDSAIFIDFLVIALYLFVLAAEREKRRTGYFFLAGAAFGVTLYTYALSYIIVPSFLFLCFFYLLWTKKIQVRHYVVMAIPLAILALPLILLQLVNMGFINEIRWTYLSIPQLDMYRGSEITLANVGDNLYLLKNLLTYDWLPYTALPEFGTLYYITIPFVLAGIIISVKECCRHIKAREYHAQDMMVFLFFCILCLAMVLDRPTISRALAIYFNLMIFAVVGLRAFYHRLRDGMPVVLALYALTFVLWCGFYFYVYPDKYYPQLLFDDCEYGYAIEYFDREYDYSDRRVYIDAESTFNVELETLLFTQTSTFEYERKEERVNEYYLYLPEEFDEDGVYIVHEDSPFLPQLAQKGYELEDSAHGFGLYVRE